MTSEDARILVTFFSSQRFVQKDGLDVGSILSTSKESIIEMELVEGSREEIYWEKIPEKIKREATTKAQERSSHTENASPAKRRLPQDSQTMLRTPSYPSDCLVFVKNIHPETNKTVLRTLFNCALDTDVEAIDYVDFVKGMVTVSCTILFHQSSHLLIIYIRLVPFTPC